VNWDLGAAVVSFDKPQKSNPNQLSVRQHVFPLKSIARFADDTGATWIVARYEMPIGCDCARMILGKVATPATSGRTTFSNATRVVG
jgi:hypothetical protein